MAANRRSDNEGTTGTPTTGSALSHLAVVLPVGIVAVLAIWGLVFGWVWIPGTDLPAHDWIVMAGGLLLIVAVVAFVAARLRSRR
ncbi:hypothetical protein [Granulibacter bethesdensis]|uniref:hypothetical protein n=1 Tax=Granulibacter bethesdensis TaxID=364410 RepID=UPI000909AD6C|nr:hypothetical protein [Granulibacter bethesdensis]APH60321.1 Hypothetical protein GbCGDNIH7_1982 [Granulibacter bethesdensis]